MSGFLSSAKDAGFLTAEKIIKPACLGIYAWDMVVTFWFECWLIRRKIAFKWPYIPYFVARYTVFAVLVIGATQSSSSKGSFDCQIYSLAVPIMGNLIYGCASLNLTIRTLSVIRQVPGYRRAAWPLIAVGVGHWAVLIYCSRLLVCSAPSSARQLTIQWLYTIAYNLLALVLSTAALIKMRPRSSSLVNLLLKQGIGYFVVTFIANIIPTIVVLLRADPVLIITIINPSLMAGVMASSRVVTQLIDWRVKQVSLNIDGVLAHGNAEGRPTAPITSYFHMPRALSTFECRRTDIPARTSDRPYTTGEKPQEEGMLHSMATSSTDDGLRLSSVTRWDEKDAQRLSDARHTTSATSTPLDRRIRSEPMLGPADGSNPIPHPRTLV